MKRVVITRKMLGLASMQVCAVKNATDVEILKVCNTENHSGTTAGWTQVVRDEHRGQSFAQYRLPNKCDDYPDRIHFIVNC